MRNWCCLASLWTEADFCLSMKSPISQIRKRLWKRSTCKYLRLNEGCLINNTPYYYKKVSSGASEISLVVKNLPANAGDIRDEFDLWVRKIPWRRAWYPTPVFLPRKFLWTEEPDGLQSVGSQRVGHDWSDLDLSPKYTPLEPMTKSWKMSLGVNNNKKIRRSFMDLLETCWKCGFELSGSCYENRKRHEVEMDFQNPKGEKVLQNFNRKRICTSTQVVVSVGSKLLAGRHLYTSLHSIYF